MVWKNAVDRNDESVRVLHIMLSKMNLDIPRLDHPSLLVMDTVRGRQNMPVKHLFSRRNILAANLLVMRVPPQANPPPFL